MFDKMQFLYYNIKAVLIKQNNLIITRCGEVWYRAWFGTRMPQVRVLSPRPYRVFITNLNVGNGHSIFYFHFWVDFCLLFIITHFLKCVTHYDTFNFDWKISQWVKWLFFIIFLFKKILKSHQPQFVFFFFSSQFTIIQLIFQQWVWHF